jgi:hypothetical protein
MDHLIKHIGEKWICTPDRYPEMKDMNEEEKLRFVLRHSALHFSKTAGKIASASENTDHGEKLQLENLKRNTAKSLINTLYLAGQLKMTEKELGTMVIEIVDGK